MESTGSLIVLIGLLVLAFAFFYMIAGLIQRIFGPALGSIILLIITFGIFGGGDDC